MNKYENGVIKYQIDFERYKNGQANEIISLLDNADKEISKYIKSTSGVYTKARYKEIASKLREISSELKKKVGDNIDVDGIIDYVFKREGKLLSSVGFKDVKYPTAEQVRTSALFKPATDGLTYESYLNGIENGLFNTWDSAVRTGYLTGQTTQQIVRNVMGGVSQTEKLKQAGLINPLRNSVYGNTKTLLQSFANETRNMVYEQNEDIFPKDYEKYEYLATLDSRTCLVCGSLDGKLFKNIKDAPQPPLHRGCRCMLIFHFDIEGDTRASKNGQVKADITFEDWLKEQDEKTQKDVLGVARYQMYKNGVAINQFVDNGQILTLEQLESRLPVEELSQNVYKSINLGTDTKVEYIKPEDVDYTGLEKAFNENLHINITEAVKREDIKAVTEVYNALLSVDPKYRYFSVIDVSETLKDSEIMQTGLYNDLVLNKKAFSNYEQLIKIIENSTKMPKNATIQSLVMHEVSHSLEASLAKYMYKDQVDVRFAYGSCDIAKQVLQKTKTMLNLSNIEYEKALESISGLAKVGDDSDSLSECFNDCWANKKKAHIFSITAKDVMLDLINKMQKGEILWLELY